MLTKDAYYILDADREWARARILEIEQAIEDLGPEFEEAFNQSSETWHDNAPFEAVRDKQTLLAAERFSLLQMIGKASLDCPKPAKGKVGIGSIVTVREGSKTSKFFIAGHWSPNIGELVDGAIVTTCVSPIGQALIGKSVGQVAEIVKPPRKLVIELVEN
jgi:transcription elongation GreA/GreB family factor